MTACVCNQETDFYSSDELAPVWTVLFGTGWVKTTERIGPGFTPEEKSCELLQFKIKLPNKKLTK